jgi:hypothetical protein
MLIASVNHPIQVNLNITDAGDEEIVKESSKKKKWIIIGIVIAAVVAAQIIAIGLGVGLAMRNRSEEVVQPPKAEVGMDEILMFLERKSFGNSS